MQVLKSYTKTIDEVGDITIGKTYYKDKSLGYPISPKLMHITINDVVGGVVSYMLDNGATGTLSDSRTMDYINVMGGYSDTE